MGDTGSETTCVIWGASEVGSRGPGRFFRFKVKSSLRAACRTALWACPLPPSPETAPPTGAVCAMSVPLPRHPNGADRSSRPNDGTTSFGLLPYTILRLVTRPLTGRRRPHSGYGIGLLLRPSPSIPPQPPPPPARPQRGGPSDRSESLRILGPLPPVHRRTSHRRITRRQTIRKG